ncbi:MAG: hypothetical protein GVY19_09020 [Bacteroidetes bacterium]|jgi:hypothetical protein|nr:hypothetical protein [Bacteroidota bacterium]
MNKIKIYLRSVNNDNEKRLALFDTERNGAIDELVTYANPGDLIIWKLDNCSNIKTIDSIFPKLKDGKIFRGGNPKKGNRGKTWKYRIPKDAEGDEAYGIGYTIGDGTSHIVDPQIRIKPPA